MKFINNYNKSILNRSEAIYLCDENGYIKLFNNAAISLWGKVPQTNYDLYCGSTSLFNIEGTPLAKEDYPVAKIILEKKAIESVELIMEVADGSKKKIIQSSTPLFDILGELTGSINLLIEVIDTN